jgi:DNA-binding response OmpR family regulator
MSAARRVLLVEDDAVSAFALRALFERTEFALDVATDGYEALECIRTKHYSAILLDLVIHGGLNGFGVLNYIELEHPELVARVFLITGMSEQTVMQTAPQLLPRLFRKPFDPDALVAAVTAVAAAKVPAVAESAARTLVVEDDPVSVEILRAIVALTGTEVDVAVDGKEAIEKMSNASYGAILLDVVLPKIDGFGVVEYLRRVRPELLARTILITGLPDRYLGGIERTLVCAVLEKPIDPTRVRLALEKCLLLPRTARP